MRREPTNELTAFTTQLPAPNEMEGIGMNELTAFTTQLPKTIEDVAKFVLVGREKLVSVHAEIRAIDKLELAQEVRDQKRDEARMLSEALLIFI